MGKTSKEAWQLLQDGNIAFSRASAYGMCVDVDYCINIDKKLEKRLNALEQKILKSKLGRYWRNIYSKKTNINSDQQLAEILFTKLKLPVLATTAKGNPSVNADVLDMLKNDRPEIQFISEYKKIYVAKNTFIQGFLKEQVDNLIHPNFNLNIARSFRSTSSNPNFQNNPKRDKLQKKIVRRALIPRPDTQLGAFDFGGIEVRVACCVTQDPKLRYDTVHGDMHRDMAIEIFKLLKWEKTGSEKILRNGAKNGFVFPQFYGDYYGNNAPTLLKWAQLPTNRKFSNKDGIMLMTGKPIGAHLIDSGLKSPDKFTNHIKRIEQDFWNVRYSKYGKWKKSQIAKYHKRGYLRLITGFVCKNIMFKNDITNYPMQGPASHCLLKCFIEADRQQQKEHLKSRLIGQIHDELNWNIMPHERELITHKMRYIMKEWLPKQWKWIDIDLAVEADIFPINSAWSEDPETITL